MAPTRKDLSQTIKRIVAAVIKPLTRWKKSRRKRQYPESSIYLPAEHSLTEPGPPDPGGRYASVADLCAHVGEQLPVLVVKLIAREVLRDLENLHTARGAAGYALNLSNIRLSHRDMRALVSQPSVISFDNMLTSTDTSMPVFRLSNVESGSSSLGDLAENKAICAPEVLLGAPYEAAADMWTLGCVVYQLLAGESLFDPGFQTGPEFGISTEESHFIQIIELLGQFPEDLLSAGIHSARWFTEAGALRIDTQYYPTTLESILRSRMEDDEAADATAFLDTILQLRPQDRATAQDILNHKWFTT